MSLAKEQIRIALEQSEKEVQDLHQRTKEGIKTARLNGKQIRQKQGAKLTTKKPIEAKKQILFYLKCYAVEGFIGKRRIGVVSMQNCRAFSKSLSPAAILKYF